MKKKLLAFLLTFVMLLSVLPVGVLAKEADPKMTFTFEADKTVAVPGDVITFTTYVQANIISCGWQFELDIPDGLTYVPKSGAITDGVEELIAATDECSFTERSKVVVVVGLEGLENLDVKQAVVTFQCTVDEDAEVGFYSVGAVEDYWDVMDADCDSLDKSEYAVINAEIYVGEVEVHTHDYNAVVTAPDCQNKGYTTYTCECGDTYVDDYVNVVDHNFSEWTADGSALTRTCSYCGKTEQKFADDSQVKSLLKLIRCTASLKTIGGEEYVALTLTPGKTAAGIYIAMNDGGTVEITDINGNVQCLADRYVAYLSQNMSNPTAVITFNLADGTSYTYPVVFELYDMELVIDFDPAKVIKPIRGKVSLASDGRGDYIVVEMVEGQSSVGIYKASLDGSIVTFIDAEGMYTEQEKLHIFYGSQNDFNPEGRVSITTDGVTKTYRILYKLYETDPYVNIGKGLRPIRGAVYTQADGTIRIKMTSGQTSVGLYKTTANGTTFVIKDENGKLTNNPSSLMFYQSNNVANTTATIVFTMPDGTEQERKIVFDMGLEDDPDPIVYLEAIRGTVTCYNDGTEDIVEVKAEAGSTGVGLRKDCFVDYDLIDIDGVMAENDSRYYFYKSQNPDGATGHISVLQKDGSYKTYTLKIVF